MTSIEDSFHVIFPQLNAEYIKSSLARLEKNYEGRSLSRRLFFELSKEAEQQEHNVEAEDMQAVSTRKLAVTSERFIPVLAGYGTGAVSYIGVFLAFRDTWAVAAAPLYAYSITVGSLVGAACMAVGGGMQLGRNRLKRRQFDYARRGQLRAIMDAIPAKKNKILSVTGKASAPLVGAPNYEALEKESKSWKLFYPKSWPSRLQWFDAGVIAKRVVDLTNYYRMRLGLPCLFWSEALAQIALKHCQDMKEGTVPVGSGGAKERFERYPHPYVNAGENVAFFEGRSFKLTILLRPYKRKRVKYDVAREMFEEWLVSSPHRTNIEGDYNSIGVGAVMGNDYEWYAVQLFAKWAPWTQPSTIPTAASIAPSGARPVATAIASTPSKSISRPSASAYPGLASPRAATTVASAAPATTEDDGTK